MSARVLCYVVVWLAAARVAPVARDPAAAAVQQPAPSGGARPWATSPAPNVSSWPPELRAKAQALLTEDDERKRAVTARELAYADPKITITFLLWLLESDPSPLVRNTILGRFQQTRHPAILDALKNVAASTSNLQTMKLALQALHMQRTTELVELLEKRIADARSAGETTGLHSLAAEHERWLILRKGAALPGFLAKPPPVFSAKRGGRAVRVLAFGDFGNGTDNQRRVGAAMARFHGRSRFDFAITLGDNFYNTGLATPDDPRWRAEWELVYTKLGIPFYASLGNHDWGHPDSPAAEILYTRKSKSWRMPSAYYTFTAGPAQFYALDTDDVSEAQRLWLEHELGRSQARWKIVYGHHPIYSHGRHGDTQSLVQRLLPLIENTADVYISGHEHDLQHVRSDGRLQLFISGGGGAGIRPIEPGARSVFARSSHGFTVFDIGEKQIRVRFVDPDLRILYEHTLAPAR